MALSDHFPQMKGWTPVEPAVNPAAPQVPNPETQVSPYLRTTLPLPLQYSPDTLRQYIRPGLSSYRIAPLPPGGIPAVNAAATSVVNSSTTNIISGSVAGPNGAVQFNNGGTPGGVSQFEWLDVSSTLQISGSLIVSNPIGIISGGTGTSTPALVAGTDITITGTWPNNTIAVATQGGVTPGSYTYASLTVDGSGIITAVSNGTPPLINPMTTLGDIIYENSVPAPARLAGNTTTTKEYLSQTGSGTVSAAPVWAQISAVDLSNGVTGSGAIVLASSPTLLGTPVVGLASYTAAVTNSPAFTIAGSYENATTPTYAEDYWTIQDVVGSGLNGTSTLTWAHSGTSGTAALSIPFTINLGNSGQISSGGSFVVGSNSSLLFTNASRVKSPSDGVLKLSNNGETSFTRLQFGGTTSSFVALGSSGTTLTVLLADGTSGGVLQASTINGVTSFQANGTPGVTQTAIAVGTLATINGIVTTFTGVSDERLKVWKPYEGGLAEILGISPIRFRWNTRGQELSGQCGDRDYIGFSAQNAQKFIPETIQGVTEKEEYLSFDDRPIIAALVNAVKELSARVYQLEHAVN